MSAICILDICPFVRFGVEADFDACRRRGLRQGLLPNWLSRGVSAAFIHFRGNLGGEGIGVEVSGGLSAIQDILLVQVNSEMIIFCKKKSQKVEFSMGSKSANLLTVAVFKFSLVFI